MPAPNNRICQVEFCDRKHWANNYCQKHNRQVQEHGHILTGDYLSEQGRKARAVSSGSKGKHWSEEAKQRQATRLYGVQTNTGRTHFQKGHETWNTGKHLVSLVNEDNPNWKGDKVGKVALHSWVKRRLGRPMQCWNCKMTSDNPQMIQWANKSQEYKRDLNDWLRLCAKCHKMYDTGRLSLTEIGV